MIHYLNSLEKCVVVAPRARLWRISQPFANTPLSYNHLNYERIGGIDWISYFLHSMAMLQSSRNCGPFDKQKYIHFTHGLLKSIQVYLIYKILCMFFRWTIQTTWIIPNYMWDKQVSKYDIYRWHKPIYTQCIRMLILCGHCRWLSSKTVLNSQRHI